MNEDEWDVIQMFISFPPFVTRMSKILVSPDPGAPVPLWRCQSGVVPSWGLVVIPLSCLWHPVCDASDQGESALLWPAPPPPPPPRLADSGGVWIRSSGSCVGGVGGLCRCYCSIVQTPNVWGSRPPLWSLTHQMGGRTCVVSVLGISFDATWLSNKKISELAFQFKCCAPPSMLEISNHNDIIPNVYYFFPPTLFGFVSYLLTPNKLYNLQVLFLTALTQ